VIRVAGLGVAFDGRTVLGDVDLPIHRGCILGVVGPSGCGKSTFLSCLNRISDLVPDCQVTGSIAFDGEEILARGVDRVGLRRRIGMIFQRPNPFPLSIRRNLTFPLREHGVRDRAEREERAESALRRVGLWEEVAERLDSPALGLSGGQQQRLCLARALVLEPEVILLDEPCSALDPIASETVESLIASLRRRYTVVVVTHNLAQARRIADDVAVFWTRDGVGTVVEHGAAEDVFERPASELTAAYVAGTRG